MNKIDYIGLVSHEIKTPIASITGYADIIRNGMVDEDTGSQVHIYKKVTAVNC